MRYAWIDAQRRDYPLADMCEVLAVSASGYKAWRGGGSPTSTRPNDAQATAVIKELHVFAVV